MFKQHIGEHGLTVKPLSDTGRAGRVDGLKPIHHQLGDAYESLLSVAEGESLTGVSGAKTRCEARGTAAKINPYPLMCSVITWYDII